MPIELKWVNDSKRIVESVYRDPLSIKEVLQALDRLIEYLDSAEGKVVNLVDLRGITRLPPSLFYSFPRIAGHPARRHKNIGPLIILIDNPQIERALQVFLRVYGRVPIFSDEESARAAAAAEAARLL